jgi:hypothetical protein
MSNDMDITLNVEHDHKQNDQVDLLNLHNEPFYFETDALALRDNPDYSCLLKTLVLLEAQRVRACEDLENLISTKERALNNPLEFLKYLSGDIRTNEYEMPPRQTIYLTPDIDWNKYYSCVDFSNEDMISNQNLMQKFHSLRRKRPVEPVVASLSSTVSNVGKRVKQAEDKIVNYNKSWDVDEQRRLEELLIEFPPEDNEAARWRKIATKLGSRTPLQVQSHCQKFFIKLAKAGLPVPGRMPNMKTYVTKKGTRGGTRKGHVMNHGIRGPSHTKRIIGRGTTLNEISSMLSSFNPPVTMNDDNENLDDNSDNYYDDDDDNDEINNNTNDMNSTLVNAARYDESDNDDDDDDDDERNGYEDEFDHYADSSSNQLGNRNFDDADEDYYNTDHDGATHADSNGFLNASSQKIEFKLEPLALSDNEFNDTKLDAYFKNTLR